VGWVRRREVIDGSRIRPGDVIVGLPSTGLHTNGYSLARKVLLEKEGIKLTQQVPELGWTLGEELLSPHRCYGKVLQPLLRERLLNGLVHVTGGGITDNTPRILPRGTRAVVRLGSWPVFPIFELIARRGRVPEPDMLRTFNMGIGMMMIVAKQKLARLTTLLSIMHEKYWIIGDIRRGKPGVQYVGDL